MTDTIKNQNLKTNKKNRNKKTSKKYRSKKDLNPKDLWKKKFKIQAIQNQTIT